MKKSLLFVAGLALSLFVNAQSSFQLTVDTVPYPAAVHNYVFNTDTSNWSAPTFMIEFRIKNTSSSTKFTKIKKKIITEAPNHDIYFCYASQCWSSGTYYAASNIPAGTMLPNGSGSYGLRTEMDHWGGVGQSIVRYTVYDSLNVTDSVNVTITYNVAGANAINNTTKNIFISNPAPNPASNVVNFNYDLGGITGESSVKIYNALGTLVKTVALNPNLKAAQLDVSSLEEGFYLYSIVANGKAISTKRLVIAR